MTLLKEQKVTNCKEIYELPDIEFKIFVLKKLSELQ